MAPSSSSSSKSKRFSPPSSSCRSAMLVILVILVALVGSCSATRLGNTVTMVEYAKSSVNRDHTRKFNPRNQQTGFRFRGQIFSYFPKGTPVPPSGPSKRHNSFIDSTPPN